LIIVIPAPKGGGIYSDSKVAVSRHGVEQAFMPAFMPAVKRHRKYRLQPLR